MRRVLGKKMNDIQQFKPISQLPLAKAITKEALENADKLYKDLLLARNNPYVLDQETLDRSVKLYIKELDNAWIFEEQIRRWKEAISELDARQKELHKLEKDRGQYKQLANEIIKLCEEVKKNSIDAILNMADDELAMKTILGEIKL